MKVRKRKQNVKKRPTIAFKDNIHSRSISNCCWFSHPRTSKCLGNRMHFPKGVDSQWISHLAGWYKTTLPWKETPSATLTSVLTSYNSSQRSFLHNWKVNMQQQKKDSFSVGSESWTGSCYSSVICRANRACGWRPEKRLGYSQLDWFNLIPKQHIKKAIERYDQKQFAVISSD